MSPGLLTGDEALGDQIAGVVGLPRLELGVENQTAHGKFYWPKLGGFFANQARVS